MGGQEWGEERAWFQDTGESIQVPFKWPIIRMSHVGGGGAGANAELFEVRESVIGVEVA